MKEFTGNTKISREAIEAQFKKEDAARRRKMIDSYWASVGKFDKIKGGKK
jgi:hypothetical protein